MVGASIDNDWSAALWRGEEEGLLLADADADEIPLLPLSCFLPPPPSTSPPSPAKRNWRDRPRTRFGLSGLSSHLANAVTSSSRIDGGMCLATSSAKFFLVVTFWLPTAFDRGALFFPKSKKDDESCLDTSTESTACRQSSASKIPAHASSATGDGFGPLGRTAVPGLRVQVRERDDM